MMLFNSLLLPLKKAALSSSALTWFSDDFYVLLVRLGINLLFLTILIRFCITLKRGEKIIYSPIT